MNNEQVQTTTGGGSCALQGCLFGAVALFVIMLIGILYLAYQQFRDNTQPPTTEVSFANVEYDAAAEGFNVWKPLDSADSSDASDAVNTTVVANTPGTSILPNLVIRPVAGMETG